MAAKKFGVNPGGDIMPHGFPKEYAWVGKAHTLHDWTDGCVAVTDEEMDEIWKWMKSGNWFVSALPSKSGLRVSV